MKFRLTFIILSTFIFSVFTFGQVNDQNLSGDTVLIRGTVKDLAGVPIAGVSISVLGESAAPAITDTAGVFKLTAPEGPKRLLINSLDHANKDLFIEDEKDLRIYLAPVNVPDGYRNLRLGYDQAEARDLVFAVDHINFDERKYNDIATTTGDYLQGKIAGLLSIHNSAMPGRGSYLLMRGQRSLNTSDQPLVIIDGIPVERPGTVISRIEGNAYNPLSGINPLDISEITVLKDAGLSSLYGVMGSNGVILINTLNPTATQTTVDLMIRGGISAKPSLIPQLNSQQFKVLANEILATSNLYEEDYEERYAGLYLQPGDLGHVHYQHDTEWQDEIFTTGGSQEVNMLVKGGDEISRYGLSVGYLNGSGNIKNTGFTRYNIRFTSYLKVYSWLEMNVNANLNNYNTRLIPSALNQQASPILTALSKAPILGPFNYDDNGNQLQTTADVKEFEVSNPRAVVNRSKSENTNNRFILSINLKANIRDHLHWNSMFGLTLNSLKEELFRPENGMAEYFGGLAYSYSEENTNQFNSIYTQHYLNYHRIFGQQHEVSGSVGFRLQTNKIEHDWGRAQNLPDNDQFSELQSGDNSLRQLGGMTELWNRMGSYATGRYVYKDKYLASANATVDFSSRNGKESASLLNVGNMPLGLFYSVGAGWRLSKEAFLTDQDWMENLMIRASYGKAGNDDIGNINALNYHSQVRYRETSGLIPGTVANLSLKHEDSHQLNVGMDFGVLGNRYAMAVDLFRNTTTDLFFYEPQLAFIGYLNRPANDGEIMNQGVELSGFARIIAHKNLTWDIQGNFTFLQNEVTDVYADLITQFEGGSYITRKGEEATSYYGYNYLGVFETSLDAEESGLINSRGLPFGAGDAIFEDISGPEGIPDGIIDDYDKTILGSPVPDYFGAIQQHLRYKKLSLFVTLNFVIGNEAFNYVRYRNEQMSDLHNQSISVLQRWQREGDQTTVPRALWNDPVGNSAFSSRWIEDGSYLRLKEVTFSYRFKDQFLLFRNAEFFVSAINLVTLTKYLGYDPEFSHSYQSLNQGIDYGLMPQTRQLIAGIKVGL